MPLTFCSKRGDDRKLQHPKMQDRRRFGEVILNYRTNKDLGESEIQVLKTTIISSHDIKEESQISLADVKMRIARSYNEDSLAWWDKNQL